jgi:alpha-tubulin suppressor-like RCC1 family protein
MVCAFALANDGKLYHWGRNTDGIRGDGSTNGTNYAYASVCQIDVLDYWTPHGNRWYPALFVNKLSQGQIHTWASGYQTQGSLGIWWSPGDGAVIDSAPVGMPPGEWIVDLMGIGAVGDAGTPFMAISAITNKNRNYIWGRNSSGAFVQGADDVNRLPLRVTDMGNRAYD